MLWFCTGNEEKCKITIEYARKFQSVLGVWTVPLRRHLQCTSRPAFLRVNDRLMRHISGETRIPPVAVRSELDTALPDLSIVDLPYRAAT